MLLESAHRIFGELGRGVERARLIAEGHEGVLEIGYMVPAMLGFLPGVIRRFRAEHPRVVLRLRERSSAPQLEALRFGQLDAALVSGTYTDPDVRRHLSWSEPAVALLPETHTLAGRDEVALAELRNESFISFPRSQAPGLYDHWLMVCLNAGFSPRIVQEAQSWHMIATLVAVGLGVAIAPGSVRLLGTPNVHCARISTEGPVFQLSLCTRTDPPAPALAAFIAAVLTEAQERGLSWEAE